jgi:seryl-tRNA synthetase
MKYYSEILNKNFDSVEDLEKAEEEHKAEQAKKEEAKALVKKESSEVEDAFKVRNAARKDYNVKLVEARKAYNEALRKAKDEFEASLKDSTEALEKAEADYDTRLKAFQKAHPEGYHITLKDGDNVVTYTSNLGEYQIRSIDKEFDDMLDLFSNFLRRW